MVARGAPQRFSLTRLSLGPRMVVDYTARVDRLAGSKGFRQVVVD
jgi:hypothetical protein